MNAIKHCKALRLMFIALMGIVPGCGSGDFLGLEDYQRDLLVGGLLAATLLNQPTGTGIQCWDTNSNGINDPSEDLNGDGAFDLADCLLGAGFPLPDGLSCWDLNGNGMADAEEDVNGDGTIDVFDCRGTVGTGEPGAAGIDCWDTNGNGVQDTSEDLNGDGIFDALDCQGEAGLAGASGSSGAPGAPGIALFHVFVDDFFATSGTPNGALPVLTTDITEPALGTSQLAGKFSNTVAYRMAIPEMYNAGNDVTMRIHFYRTGPFLEDECFIMQLDARRLSNGTGVETYGSTRWVRIDFGDATPNGVAVAIAEEGTLVTIDLPINRSPGLDFPNDLAVADFLAFELTTFNFDSGLYEFLAVEFFETRPGTSTLTGATLFTTNNSEDPAGARCEFDDCNNNLVPDDRDIVNETSADCNENGTPDECDIESGFSADCNENGTPDECELGGNDCNQNGTLDECDIRDEVSDDCNTNGVPDECEIFIESSAPGGPFFCTSACGRDDNNNGLLDECDPDCICHDDVDAVCNNPPNNTASEGTQVFYDPPVVNGDCLFTCGDAAGVAGENCSVQCTSNPGSFFAPGVTEVTCSSFFIGDSNVAGIQEPVDTCSFVVNVNPIATICSGTISGSYSAFKGPSGLVEGTLLSDGTFNVTFIGLDDGSDTSLTGSVSDCGHMSASLSELFVSGTVFDGGQGCEGSGSFSGFESGTWDFQIISP